MTLELELASPPDSWLRRRDARWKLAAFLLAAALFSLVRTPVPAILALLLAVSLAALARLPGRWYLRRLLAVAMVLLPFLLLLPWTIIPDDTIWAVGRLHLSLKQLQIACVLFAKALAIVSLMLVLLTSAPRGDLLKAARALRLPGLLVHLALLTHRYLYVLGTEFARLRVALRSRGYRPRLDRHTYKTIGHVTGSLLVRGYERAERVGQAMACRGFDGEYRTLHEFQASARDVLFFLGLTVLSMSILAADWMLQ